MLAFGERKKKWGTENTAQHIGSGQEMVIKSDRQIKTNNIVANNVVLSLGICHFFVFYTLSRHPTKRPRVWFIWYTGVKLPMVVKRKQIHCLCIRCNRHIFFSTTPTTIYAYADLQIPSFSIKKTEMNKFSPANAKEKLWMNMNTERERKMELTMAS